MEEMNNAIMAATTPVVQMWMNWMVLVFMASPIFVWKHKPARLVLLSFILTLPLALLIFSLSKQPHLIGIAHMAAWMPLAFYLVRVEIKRPAFNPRSAYGVWMMLLLGTIAVSLVFDARDVILVLMGIK